jgi:hypothetical protein
VSGEKIQVRAGWWQQQSNNFGEFGMSNQKYGEMITDNDIDEAVDVLAVVAQRFIPHGWSIHLQCYSQGNVFASLHDVDDNGEVRFVSLHKTFAAAIDAAIRSNSLTISESSP